MSEDTAERFDDLLEKALALAPDEQEAYIEANCGDLKLRGELLGLLAKEEELGAFLETPAALVFGAGSEDSPHFGDSHIPSFRRGLPEAIGPYRIDGTLGEGGMGIVYLAKQDEPVQRSLAVKVVRAELASPGAHERFLAERRALARLSHPFIAQMYDAGTTAEGFPYFAMELVSGSPITRYCDDEKLSIEDRLELMAKVCEAVQHAHQRGIIHRDLKPTNILVVDQDGTPTPKVIDFGIAKALDRPLTDVTQLTGVGAIGTPDFMSPESLGFSDELLDPDTRTDVYSLGVILYELLVGVRPFDSRKGNVAVLVQRMIEEEALPPSGKLAGLESRQRQEVAELRQLRAEEIRRRIAGDLDWISARAVAKDRDRRYDFASELAADLRRHLRDEPVTACPPSLVYRFSKLVRRHRVAAAAVGVAVLALALGIVGLGVGLVQARRAEADALSQAESARQVSEFLVELFEVADPFKETPENLSALELVSRGAERVSTELVGQPLVQARMMTTLGRVHSQLELNETAEVLLEEALRIRKAELGGYHVEVAESLRLLGEVYDSQGRQEDAEVILAEALSIQEQLFGADDTALVETLTSLASTHTRRGDFSLAEAQLRRALTLAEGAEEPDSLEVARILYNIGRICGYQGRMDEASALLQKSLTIRESALGDDHPLVAKSLISLANALNFAGENLRAEELQRRALAILESALGPDHSNVTILLSNLGYHLYRMGRYEEAREVLERAVGVDEKNRTVDAYAAARCTNLGLVYWKLGRLAEAEPLFHQATSIRDRVLKPGHPHRATSIWGLANVYRDQGRFDEAESLYRNALEIREQALPTGHRELVDSQREYAILLRKTGRDHEAAALEERIRTAFDSAE